MRLVIFDLDGVLVNSTELFEKEVKEALDNSGYALSIEEVKKARVPNVETWVDSLLPSDSIGRAARVRELSARVRAAVAELSGQLALRPEARRVLSALAANHCLFLLTNSSLKYTRNILVKDRIDELFERVITSDDPFETKEQALAYLAERYRQMPRDLIYVGDSVRDVICARNTGCRAIILYTPWSWDYERRAAIEAAGPAAIVESLDAVVGLLDKGSK